MTAIRVLIVDDEPLAREGIRCLLEAEKDMTIVGECSDGVSARDTMQGGGIDVVLLDVQMPGLTGFEVVQAIPEASLPVVVFITAYDHHAVRAFEASATDYVVKPFSDERFRASLARARRQVHQRRIGEATAAGLASLMAQLQPGKNPMAGRGSRSTHYADRIAVRSIGRVAYVRVRDIEWITSADYYSELHTVDGRKQLVREPLQRLEERLDPAVFCRVHRTAIVRLESVGELRSEGVDRQSVVLRNGVRIPLSTNRREALEQRLAVR